METNNKLVFNFLIDLTKKDIDKFNRAVIIRQYLNDEKISIRELGRRLNVPKSTLEDWLLYNKLSKEKYDELKSNGFSTMKIYKSLRENKFKKVVSSEDIVDSKLKDVSKDLRMILRIIKYGQKSGKTKEWINTIRNTLNRIEMRVDNKVKKKEIQK